MHPGRAVYFDVSELSRNPINTGIQRVVRKLAEHWPRGSRLIPCKYDQELDELVGLSSEEAERLFPFGVMPTRPGIVGLDEAVLIPELFFDPARCRFHQRRAGAAPFKTFAFVHDFLAWTHPEALHINSRDANHVQGYWDFIATRVKTAFNSPHVRREYIRLFNAYESVTGPAIMLGSDNLPPLAPKPERGLFVSVGSIEDRKNHRSIIQAFIDLWDAGSTAKLVLIGKVVNRASSSAQFLKLAEAYPNFRHIKDADDAAVADLLSRAQASIFVSELEGYGLPPVESLWAGVPVIVPQGMPCLEGLPSGGQIRLSTVTPETIRHAVQAVIDGKYGDLAASIDRGSLPTWSDCARNISGWIARETDHRQAAHRSTEDGTQDWMRAFAT
jgi:glycosyltransferase involved in cell wall biosynthesis